MNLPKWATTVTPLSKTIALVIFTIFPMLAFFFGMKYQEAMTPYKIQDVPQLVIKEIGTADTERSLINRCGEFEGRISVKLGQFDRVAGPSWAPDCRHVAWSVWGYAVGLPTNKKWNDAKDGVFLYDDNDKTTKKIYTPVKPDEEPALIGWTDRDNFRFRTGGKDYTYNLASRKITPFK